MIQAIELKNFKCFEDEAFDLKTLNMLTGLNGMGKSTLIQALLLLRQHFDMGNYEDISLNGDLVRLGNSKDLRHQYLTISEVVISLIDDAGNRANWGLEPSEPDSDHLLVKSQIERDHPIFTSSLFGNHFHYIGADRLGPREYYETSNYKVRNRNQIGLRGEYAANFLLEFGSQPIPIPEMKHDSPAGLTLREQVNAWLGEIRPGTRVSAQPAPDMGLVGLKYRFAAGNDLSNEFRPTNVGGGFSFLLPILVALLSSPKGGLVVVENPEAHLHPKGQAQMGRLFALAAANGIQLIVETHSDHVLNGVRVAVKEGLIEPQDTHVLFFTGAVIEGKFKHYTLSPQIDRNGRIDQWPQGFFDEWEQQLTNLM